MSRWNPIDNTDTALLDQILDSKDHSNQAVGSISVETGPFGETRVSMSLVNGPHSHRTHSAHCSLTLNAEQVEQLVGVLVEAGRLARATLLSDTD